MSDQFQDRPCPALEEEPVPAEAVSHDLNLALDAGHRQ